MQAGMGQEQTRMLQTQFAPEEQIQIQSAGPPALFMAAIAAMNSAGGPALWIWICSSGANCVWSILVCSCPIPACICARS